MPRLIDMLADAGSVISTIDPLIGGVAEKLVIEDTEDGIMLYLGEECLPVPSISMLNYSLELLLYRAGYGKSDVERITSILAPIIKEALDGAGITRLQDLASRTKVREREEIIDAIYTAMRSRHHYMNVYDTLECYENGVYVECEDKIAKEIEELAENYGLRPKTTRYIINEVIAKLKRKFWRDPREVMKHKFMIAFKNGLLNIKRFVETGVLEIHEFTPEIRAVHRIPWNLDIDRLERARAELGLEGYSEPPNILALAEKLCPKTLKAFIDWVGEDMATLLFELIGYCMYPEYSIQKAFMLVGEGANGKSTYLKLIRVILGNENIASVSLQELSENRFKAAELYRKLANIYADLPEAPLRDPGAFKMLTGGDEMTVERKYKDPFSFVNYAKLIFSANRLPRVNENTKAFWRRWILIEFPNQFPDDPTFFERTFTKKEIEGIILVSLVALRNVMMRRGFTVPKDKDLCEEWMKRSNNVYRFIKEMEQKGYIVLDKKKYVEKEELYSMYSKWCNEADETPASKKTFTQELNRLFGVRATKKRIRGKKTPIYEGIEITGDPWEKEDEETEDQGLLGFS